jgi:hypothetical protein
MSLEILPGLGLHNGQVIRAPASLGNAHSHAAAPPQSAGPDNAAHFLIRAAKPFLSPHRRYSAAGTPGEMGLIFLKIL